MLSPTDIAALITATTGAVDLFDKIAGQIKSVLTRQPRRPEGDDDDWKVKIGAEGSDIVVRKEQRTIQTLSADQLAKTLNPSDLALVTTYEEKMQQYFRLWQRVYAEKDMSNDALANAKTDDQLHQLVLKMRAELLGILGFLEHIGVQLDDHYMHIRSVVQAA